KKGVGTKADELPEAINILTCIKHINRDVPGFQEAYDSLSEYAHPNWMGVAGLFSRVDRANFTTHFGRGFKAEQAGGQIGNLLNAATGLFVYAYNAIADEMPKWISELDKLWPEEGDQRIEPEA